MRKKNLQSLKLNKKIIANLDLSLIKGGVRKTDVTAGDACKRAASIGDCTSRKCNDQ